MNQELLQQLQAAQRELEPQFKSLKNVVAALNTAVKLATTDKAEALDLQKASLKLQQVVGLVENKNLKTAVSTFTAETEKALNELAFEFAHSLRDAFEQRGQPVEGRPPTLAISTLTLQIHIAERKAQWFYGKEPLTNPLPLTVNGLLKAYDQQYKAIEARQLDTPTFLAELYKAHKEVLNEKKTRRANIVETYSKMVMNRQSGRFWNAPSRSTFKDYPRPFFVRDLALVQAAGNPLLTIDGSTYRLRLGGASKSQAENASKSIWLPNGAFDGEYYGDVTFETV